MAIDFPLRLTPNIGFSPGAYPPECKAIIHLDAFAKAQTVITAWPGYAPTPMHRLSGLARSVGVSEIYYKDEAPRFGLNSFKGLGGPYAVYRLLAGIIEEETGVRPAVQDIIAGTYAEIAKRTHVTTATDGNHGRAVAWGAQLFGCPCTIYIHALVSEGRKREIERYGAEVVRITGNYDDSVRQAQADAEAMGRYVISDTSYEGYSQPPTDVMQGYTVMVEEALQQIPPGERITHVFIQGGVGAMAAGIIGHLWEKLGAAAPRFVIVEPEKADCLYQSALAGKPVTVHGKLDTIMAGLACGEVSMLAWKILRPACSHFITVPDEAAMETMRLLAKGTDGDARIVAGESAVAGLAGFLIAAGRPALRDALGIKAESRLLIFGSEGDSDPELYQKILGKTAEQVRAGA